MRQFQETNLSYATDVDVFLPYVTMGSEAPLTMEPSTVTLITFSISGSSNMVFNKIFSKIDLNPLAPVFFEIAFFAISEIASSLNSIYFSLPIIIISNKMKFEKL